MIETPVLIAGAGPVGLTLALCLERLGIRSLVVNERTATTTHPKLDVVNCRSMEIFRQLGLAERVRAAGNPVTANQYAAFAASAQGPFYTVMRERHLVYQPVAQARARIRACRDGGLPLEPMQRIAQMHLEPLLLEEAMARPAIDLRMGQHLYGFEQDADGVTARVHAVDTGAGFQVRSRYLVGCDGPGSRVRHFLNIDYDGTRDLVGELFIIHLRSDALAALYPDREPYWHTWLSRPGYSGLLVSPDASRNDYVLHRPFGPRPGESLESIVDAALGAKLDYEIVQSGPWRPQFLVAEAFGRGRVFIAGDATHQYMPTGGLGMNTGVAEAHNLAWKLAACLHGWGGEALLDSYLAERLAVARRNREHVRQCAAGAFESQFETTGQALQPDASGRAVREKMARTFEAKASRMYESLGAELGYRYEGSPVVAAEDGAPPPCDTRDYRPTTWPGARLPSVFLDDGTALFDRLAPDAYTLLCLGEPDHAGEALVRAAAAAGMPLHVLPLREPWLRGLYERRYVLVRPDQHVCWRGERIPHDARGLVDLVRGAAWA